MSDSEKYNHSIPASSAIYHIIENMVFNKGSLAYRVSNILPDKNQLNIPIQNENRIKLRKPRMSHSKIYICTPKSLIIINTKITISLIVRYIKNVKEIDKKIEIKSSCYE